MFVKFYLYSKCVWKVVLIVEKYEEDDYNVFSKMAKTTREGCQYVR